MKHCDKCKIDVRGEFERCPLCQNKLTGESTPYEFPKVQSFYEKYEKIFKFAILVTSSLSIISIAVNILLPQSGHWSLFVLFGVICFWLTTNICIKKRQVISQNIAAEAVIISILCVIWDKFTGWHGWSVDYVIPIIFSWAMLGLFVATKILKIKMPRLCVLICDMYIFRTCTVYIVHNRCHKNSYSVGYMYCTEHNFFYNTCVI